MQSSSEEVITAWRRIGFDNKQLLKDMEKDSVETLRRITKRFGDIADAEWQQITAPLDIRMRDTLNLLRQIGQQDLLDVFIGKYSDAIGQAQKQTQGFEANWGKMVNYLKSRPSKLLNHGSKRSTNSSGTGACLCSRTLSNPLRS